LNLGGQVHSSEPTQSAQNANKDEAFGDLGFKVQNGFKMGSLNPIRFTGSRAYMYARNLNLRDFERVGMTLPAVLESLSHAAYRAEVLASHQLFSSLPQGVRHLVRRLCSRLQLYAGNAYRRLTNFAGICLVRKIRPTSEDSLGRLAENNTRGNKTMTKNHSTEAPSAPDLSTDMDSTITPGVVLRGLIASFTDPDVPADARDAARDLDMLLMIDPSAEHDLLDAIFHGRKFDMMTPAGMNLMVDAMTRIGALETKAGTVAPVEIPWLTFHAQPLLKLLKAMPHRDPGLGISRDMIHDCTIKN